MASSAQWRSSGTGSEGRSGKGPSASSLTDPQAVPRAILGWPTRPVLACRARSYRLAPGRPGTFLSCASVAPQNFPQVRLRAFVPAGPDAVLDRRACPAVPALNIRWTHPLQNDAQLRCAGPPGSHLRHHAWFAAVRGQSYRGRPAGGRDQAPMTIYAGVPGTASLRWSPWPSIR